MPGDLIDCLKRGWALHIAVKITNISHFEVQKANLYWGMHAQCSNQEEKYRLEKREITGDSGRRAGDRLWDVCRAVEGSAKQ